MSKNYTDKDVYHMISKYQKTDHKKYNKYISRYSAAKRCSKDTESGLMAMLIYDMRLNWSHIDYIALNICKIDNLYAQI